MTVKRTVSKMSADDCVNTSERAVKTVDVLAIVRANPQTKIISIETKAAELDIKNAIATVGYHAS